LEAGREARPRRPVASGGRREGSRWGRVFGCGGRGPRRDGLRARGVFSRRDELVGGGELA
jgi:hypothetical protein